jgi:hypothetical protein
MADSGQTTGEQSPADGAALARGWLDNSPFIAHLGIRSADNGADVAVALVTYQL